MAVNLDPSLAFTALLKFWPDPPEGTSAALATAMTEANPPDRWAFAKQWIATAQLAESDQHGPPYVVPWPTKHPLDLTMAQAIARSKHPNRVLANTNGYRYGRFEELSEAACRALGVDAGVTVTMMGSHIATFLPFGVQLWWRGHVTVTSTEALSNLVPSGSFYTAQHKIHYHQYIDGERKDQLATDGTLYPYKEDT